MSSLKEIAMRKKLKKYNSAVHNPETGVTTYETKALDNTATDEEIEEVYAEKEKMADDKLTERAEDKILSTPTNDKVMSAVKKRLFMERMKKMKGVKI